MEVKNLVSKNNSNKNLSKIKRVLKDNKGNPNGFVGACAPVPQGMYSLTEENQTINSLLSNKNVPSKIKQKFWWVFSRDVPLTFLDEKRKKDKLLAFDILKIDTLNSLPYYEYDFEVEKDLNILRNVYDIRLDRALGTNKASQLNERIVQKSQFSENRSISSDTNATAKTGFISKLLNRR